MNTNSPSSTPQSHLSKVFVTGDLNIDNMITGVALGKITRVPYIPPVVGGSAYNAAVAFKHAGFHPIVFGKIGDDDGGDLILSALERQGIDYLIDRDNAKPTGTCNIIYFRGEEYPRTIYYWSANANDYNTESLQLALKKADLSEDDFIFSSLHLYDQTDGDLDHCRAFFAELRSSGSRVIVDIVPHTIYDIFDVAVLKDIISGSVFMMIGEYRTFMNLIAVGAYADDRTPTQADCEQIARHLEAEYFLCRYGIGNISRELVFRRTHEAVKLLWTAETGYEHLPDVEKRGFGDYLTASTLSQIVHSRELV
jgi:sugar/nucleoside kinase (ribokinase family)